MQKFLIALIWLLSCNLASAETSDNSPCCGPITPAAQKILQTLDAMDVEHLWQAHRHVNWETGVSDRPDDYVGHEAATHCSAFAAAAGKRLGVYLLRPPEHGQQLLANAQTQWLSSSAALEAGWQPLENALQAQQRANLGELVVVVFQNPNPHKPGHIAIVIPSLKSMTALEQDGPQTMQAGTYNHSSWDVRRGFKTHPGAWPNGVKYFTHVVKQGD